MRPSWLLAVALAGGGCAGPRLDPMPVRPLVPADSLLRPGDVLRITVWRQPEFSGEFSITSDSTLDHPLLQTVRVGGVTLSVAKLRLREYLTGYEQNPRFVMEPLYPVIVGGEVREPGLMTLPRGTTVSRAVARAGGPSERGRLDRVTLLRGGKSYELNLLSEDQRVAGVTVSSGDQVLVGRRRDFNLLRDVLAPIASFSGAVAVIVFYTTR